MENRESRTERSSSPDLPLNLSDEPMTSDPRIFRKRSSSPDHSCVSLKSDRSKGPPPDLSNKPVTSDPRIFMNRSSCPDHSCVSLKSDASKGPPPDLSNDPVTSDPSGADGERSISGGVSSVFCLTNTSVTASLNKPDQAVNDELQRVKEQHKTSMKNKYERLCEGLKLQENESLLNSIYTQLYIIEGEREGVNEEHEVLQMEKTARTQHSQDTPIYCNDIFKTSAEAGCEEKEQIKTVLTKGIAGIGKTVSVQKFITDWAEGKANQDVDFMFVLPFRELNLIRDHQYSLHTLLLDFHPELQDLDSQIYEECNVVFIFDGLDESRITLMFSDAQKVCDVTETSSVAVLMSNLMKGELLPSAFIWITSRPAAANQIPSKYIHRLTEIQGFTEPQKEEYFRKRISDEHQASRIISHIRRARSLHIMCHIPVFCWISSTVLQKLLEEDLRAEIPQTLTEMYIHFLLIQINMRKQKYEERDPEKLLPSNREVIVKLAEVAFKQLMKGNVMFYEEDLIESGIDVTEASVYSGICTEIFKQESVIHQRKVYSFIHLSIQEFLAAFYEFYCYLIKNKEPVHRFRLYGIDEDPLNGLHTSAVDKAVESENDKVSLYGLLTSAIDKAVESENGRLDLFLRFLLGVSLESNQRLLQDLLKHTENSSETIRETTLYIKMKIRNDDVDDYFKHPPLSVGESINLFLCLLEVKDQSLSREIQEFVKSDKHSEKLSPAQCSTISYMLQMSEEPLDEFEFKKYNTSDEGRRRLISAVINCRKALFSGCNLTAQFCKSLSSALQSSNCVLRELDLRNNHLQESGVEFISDGLKSPNCQLQKLRFSGCNLTAQFCKSLSSALQSSNCVLRELDLRNNHLQDSGVEFISDGLKSPNCQLQKLSLAGCNLTAQCCKSLSSALQSSNCVLRELDLRNNHLQDSGVKFISDGLKSPNCQLQKLSLAGCNLTAQFCKSLSSALQSSNCVLRELDLRNNHLQDSGVEFISDGLKSPNCQLQKLSLAGCNLTAQFCKSLSSALQSSNCVLRELDLSNNDLQDSGVEFISDGLKSPNCQLQKLSLAGCNLTAQCCKSLSSALQSSNCVLRELDLRNNHLQDSGVEFISDGLKSPNCQLQKLRLSGCMVSEEGCGYLSSALSSNPSHLRELDLSYNHPGQSGVQLLSHKLEDPNCTLEKLNVDHGGEIRMRTGLRKWACDLTLDPNTAHTRLILSDENKKITLVKDLQLYPDHPERFDHVPQVLSVESLTGRCYWETEWSGDEAVISVSYKGINRKGESEDCWFGSNDKSWSLDCFDDEFSVCHNNKRTGISAVYPSIKRVGVYVDVSAGVLSFYSVSDTHTLTHLHTFNTTFTEPLYAGFRVYSYSSVSLCDIK
ncbi:NACHT, LRR and PYD domains-containing protein 12-like [Carassius carassius]|uniref:NACHT, LRR and PYD domains-containing protein 12-like n=1 Tax=Carassius carassius TaxID=217509 RepID=UPI00286888F4|nr:NACHT, LRR and PYD domains-containing protein 12-like [Carassius carassius]